MTAEDEERDAAEGESSFTAAGQAADDGLTLARDIAAEKLVFAIERGAAVLPAVLTPGQVAIAAAGVCGQYASVLVLFRDVDGHLCSDTHLLQRAACAARTAHWALMEVQVSTCYPRTCWLRVRTSRWRPGTAMS